MSYQPPPPPPTVIRKGRGTFTRTLHSDMTNVAPPPEAAAANSTHTSSLDDKRFAFAQVHQPRAQENDDSKASEETARVQLFRRERRRRQIIIVGDIAGLASFGVCTLFGHRGPKPLRLHNKRIRLVHLALPTQPRRFVPRKVVESDDTVDAPRDDKATIIVEQESRNDRQPAGEEGIHGLDEVGEEGGSVDQQREVVESETVAPLTVGYSGLATVLTSPVLAARHFRTLSGFFREQFLALWKLEDISKQRIQIRVEFGAGYACPSNSSRRLDEASFHELISKWNDESAQLYMLNDCPPCLSRAVDSSCNSSDVHGNRKYSVVKITFFSQERQSRTIARALWNGDLNAFELIDVEGIGVTFSWTLFSVDEKQGCQGAVKVEPPVDLRKHVAFPVEVSFRAFYRSKQTMEHSAAAIAKEVLLMLTEAEHNMLRHGSASQYDTLDLTAVCELDAASKDYRIESIYIEHVDQRKLRSGLLVESSSSMLIEGFSHDTTRRSRGDVGPGTEPISGDGSDRVERATSRLSFFKARTNMVHWKLDPDRSNEDNLALLETCMDWVDVVLAKANNISATDSRGGAAPEAI